MEKSIEYLVMNPIQKLCIDLSREYCKQEEELIKYLINKHCICGSLLNIKNIYFKVKNSKITNINCSDCNNSLGFIFIKNNKEKFIILSHIWKHNLLGD